MPNCNFHVFAVHLAQSIVLGRLTVWRGYADHQVRVKATLAKTEFFFLTTLQCNCLLIDLILPPLRDRPFLMDFPKFMKLPLPRVNLSPYQMHSEEDGIKFLDHRYYILEKSNIEYYRQKRHFHVKQ